MNAKTEFKEGKHSIGYVGSYFEEQFKNEKFEAVSGMPSHKILPRYMTDVQVESGLKPGYCTLGDVLFLIDNALPEHKDGNWNLFYFPSCVVCVRWYGGEWRVDALRRDDCAWIEGVRVFSPTTGVSSHPQPSSESLALDEAIELVKNAGYKVIKEI